jgi:hypothetical protein
MSLLQVPLGIGAFFGTVGWYVVAMLSDGRAVAVEKAA